MSNTRDTVLYTGVTSDLAKRLYQHKTKVFPGFTKKYNVEKLLYFERFDSPHDAIEREKQIKRWRRIKKIRLIQIENPNFKDLSETL